MAIVTKVERPKNKTIIAKTRVKDSTQYSSYKWWTAGSKTELTQQVLATASYLRQQQDYNQRQASIFARLYGNLPLFNFAGTNFTKMGTSNTLPIDRPTMPVITSCIDTLVSRLTQSRPRPVFLTDGGDYKERNMAKQLNSFAVGELYQTNAYAIGEFVLRDATVLGTGCVHIFEQEGKAAIERVLKTELMVDANDGIYGSPRQLYRLKLVDRDVIADMFPEKKSAIMKAENAFPDSSAESNLTVSDQIMLVEAWHLPSGENSGDGRHCIVCSDGYLLDEPWTKRKFPFVFMHYAPRLVGFWGQGLAERLMGTQIEINRLLMTISASINLVGVPRVFVNVGSKIVRSHLNNQIGAIVEYRGEKPVYEVAPCVPQELYAQLERLVRYAYEQSGVSSLSASAQKPQGINSGAGLRELADQQTDRFAALSRRYDNYYIDLTYAITDVAKDIAERDGKYQTVFVDKSGTRKIDLPSFSILKDPFVIQCFDASSLPKEPAGRMEKVTEMAQSGMISMQEARRLLDFPDLEQVEKLANAAEEKILKILDEIIEDGKYTPPDPFMDLQLATQLVTQYYNLYTQKNLEESKAQLLRDFSTQVQGILQASMPPSPAPLEPQAAPEPLPTNPLIPNGPQIAA